MIDFAALFDVDGTIFNTDTIVEGAFCVFRPNRPPIPTGTGHSFHLMSAAGFDRNSPASPVYVDQAFR